MRQFTLAIIINENQLNTMGRAACGILMLGVMVDIEVSVGSDAEVSVGDDGVSVGL